MSSFDYIVSMPETPATNARVAGIWKLPLIYFTSYPGTRHLPASRTWILQPWESCLFLRSCHSSLRRHLAHSLLASRWFGNISHLRKSVLRLRWWRVLRILWAHSYSLYLVDTQASDIFPVFPLKIVSSSKSGHRRASSRSRWLMEPYLKQQSFHSDLLDAQAQWGGTGACCRMAGGEARWVLGAGSVGAQCSTLKSACGHVLKSPLNDSTSSPRIVRERKVF